MSAFKLNQIYTNLKFLIREVDFDNKMKIVHLHILLNLSNENLDKWVHIKLQFVFTYFCIHIWVLV